MKKYLFVIGSALFLYGCSSSVTSEELIETRKEDAQQQFDHFYACYEIAKTAPPVKKDHIAWERADATTKYGESNVYQVGIESFADLSLPLDVPLDGTRRREHADMAQLFGIDLSEHIQPHEYSVDDRYSYHKIESGESCRKAILHFLDANYLLINRLTENARPIPLGDDTYRAGYVKGDVLVFDLEAEKQIGGFQIEAASKDNMSLKEYSDLGSNLMADLGMRAYRLTIEKFTDLTPTVEDGGWEF